MRPSLSFIPVTGTYGFTRGQPEVKAYLYNSTVEEILLQYAYDQKEDTMLPASTLVLEGRWFAARWLIHPPL